VISWGLSRQFPGKKSRIVILNEAKDLGYPRGINSVKDFVFRLRVNSAKDRGSWYEKGSLDNLKNKILRIRSE
jgi:hypothetical protein